LIEDVLIRHAAVQIAAAVGQPDAAKGEMPVAYVQLKPGATTSDAELLALCREQVQERAAVPAQIHIIEQLPLTAVGKVNKPALRADAMLRVAREQAAAVVGSRGTIEAAVDESGVRPRVTLAVRAPGPVFIALRQQLETVFGRFEFETVISAADPHASF
jgi:fatty-acyl-CoA synthase